MIYSVVLHRMGVTPGKGRAWIFTTPTARDAANETDKEAEMAFPTPSHSGDYSLIATQIVAPRSSSTPF